MKNSLKNNAINFLTEKNLSFHSLDVIEKDDGYYIVLEIDQPSYSILVSNDFENNIKDLYKEYNIKFVYNSPTKEKEDLPKESHKEKPAVKNVKYIIGVTSGKGGVGKSTIAFNTAVALSQLGLNIGLVDADIYGPSLPTLLGVKEFPEIEDNLMIPIKKYGIQAMSIGFIVDEEKAAIWRGPMLTKTLFQLIRGTKWDNIDILIIDLPPGTGDIQLSLMENYPMDGFIIVGTPQKLALADVKKAIAMCEKLQQKVLGVVINMSEIKINEAIKDNFLGKNVLEEFILEKKIEIFGKIPFDFDLASISDEGKCIFFEKNLNQSIAAEFMGTSEKIAGIFRKKMQKK